MSSRFVRQTSARIDLGDDWVEIRTHLSFGARRRIEQVLFGLVRDAQGRVNANEEQPLHMHEANIEALRLAIVAWGGPGFCVQADHPHDGACEARPITVENIEQLDETGERILEEVRDRQVTRTDGLKAGRRTSTTTTSRPEDPPPSSTDSTSSPSASDTAGPTTSS